MSHRFECLKDASAERHFRYWLLKLCPIWTLATQSIASAESPVPNVQSSVQLSMGAANSVQEMHVPYRMQWYRYICLSLVCGVADLLY